MDTLHYEVIARWADLFDLLANRVAVCNQLLGCKYDHSPENPMVLCYRSGEYHVSFDGCDIVTFGLYDNYALSRAYDMVDAWQDCIWMLGRAGRLS